MVFFFTILYYYCHDMKRYHHLGKSVVSRNSQ